MERASTADSVALEESLRRERCLATSARQHDAADVAVIRMENVTEAHAAFSRLVGRHINFIKALLRSKGVRIADVDDLTQDIFLQAWRKIDQLQDPRCFVNWLGTISVNVAKSRSNRKQRMLLIDDVESHEENDVPDAGLTAADHTCIQEKASIVRGALNLVVSMDSEVLALCYFEETSLKNAACRLDIPLGTLKRRLFTARKRLRAVIQERWPEMATEG